MNDPRPPRSTSDVPQSEPGVATLAEGLILLDGPDGVAVTMTVEAAEQTAASLLRAVHEAGKQPD